MSLFERALIGLVAAGVAGLFVAATLYPVESTTRAPSAVYAVPGSAAGGAAKGAGA